jgi:Protein of unknown function (DUF3187)
MSRIAIAAAMFCAAGASADDSPLRIRNLAPVAGTFAMPRALGGDVLSSGYELTFDTEVANNFTSDADGSTLAFFDGETIRLTYGYRHSWGPRWEWGIEIPYVFHHGGNTDAVIDRFHTVLGFDDDGRNRADRDQIDFFIADGNEIFVDFQNDRRDWGDVSVSSGFQILRDPARSLAVRALAEFPTGDVEKLTGSDGTDLAVWLDYTDRSLLEGINVAMTMAGGLILLGDGKLVPDKQESVAGYAHLGMTYPLSDHWTLKAQVDYQSRLIDTQVDQLGGAALQGAVGARWSATTKFWTDVAIVEDLASDSTSDLLVHFMLGVRL